MIQNESELERAGVSPMVRHRTIAVTSGKGGVGKSSVALNLAVALARRDRRVALLDGDLGLASLNVLLGLAPRWDLRHVVRGERRLAEIVLRGPHGLAVIPAGSGVAELASLDAAPRAALIAELRGLERTVDFLLVDTGAGISETVLGLVLASDDAIVVTRPEPTALTDAYALMKVVLQRRPDFPFHLLVNLVRDAAEARDVHDKLATILHRFLGYRPGDAGHVVTDVEVARAVVAQAPFVMAAPGCAASRAIEALAERLLGEPPAPDDARTFWDRLARWTGLAS